MPRPASPVVPGLDLPEVVFARCQPEYRPLPAYCTEDGNVLTRWKLTWRERLRVLFRGDLYLWVSTCHRPLQPMLIETEKPKSHGK